MASNPISSCPFVAGSMITDPRYFVGCREALDFLSSKMTAAQPTSINVVGKSKMGKSSLLYHFCQTYEQRVQRYGKQPNDYAVVYLSMQEDRCRDEERFYRSIRQELLKRPVVQDNTILFNKINNSASNRQDFSAMIDSWKDHNILPVLCLDRFDEIIDNRKNFSIDFYDNMRSLMDRSSLMLILASRKKLDVYRNISSFFNVGNVCSLTGLTEGEASDLVRLPERNVHGSTAVLSETKQKLALQWGKRNPYLLQLAGCCLWEAITNDRDEAWAKTRFDSEAQRVSKSLFHPHRWWSPLPECLTHLVALAQTVHRIVLSRENQIWS